MSDALSFAEIDVQRVELLPARTVLSSLGGDGGWAGDGFGGFGGDSGDAVVAGNDNYGGIQVNIAISGPGGWGGPGWGGDASGGDACGGCDHSYKY